MNSELKRVVMAAIVPAVLLGCGGDNGAGKTPEPVKYQVTVSSVGTGAMGGGLYEGGETVFIAAGTPRAGYAFDAWTTWSRGVTFDNPKSPTTWFVMPANAVTVTAEFLQGGDGSYESVTIGGLKWMTKNLNIETASGSYCYNYSLDSCAKYGRLYTWEAAKMACPSGWHLPDTSDWRKLVAAAGGQSTAGSKLKTTSGWYEYSGISSTDESGFSALPGGNRYSDGRFSNAGYNGFWWTATEYNSGNAYYRFMNYDNDRVGEDNNYKSYGLSVRCVKD